MKKLLMIGAIALMGTFAQAQTGFKLGAHVGLPTGDASDGYSLNVGVDASYMFPVGETFNLGVTSGYTAFLGKDINIIGFGSYKVPTLSLVPLAGTAEYKVTPEFSIMADLGYGFLFADGESDGGFYYQPKVAYTLQEKHELSLGYQGVSMDGFNYSSINLGYAYKF